jgi:RND family efflux transporter MFP subunit
MTNRHAQSLIRFLRHVVGPDGRGRDADDRLLHRFARERDQAAFAALVARHGPMVLGVCGRVLRDADDVEDAFQATFLVLARKARSLTSPHLLAPWLYGVARRTALEARLRAARRRAKECPIVDRATPDSTAQAAWTDLRPVLDEEIARLPECYRVPFVMCYLEGRTNGETARLIGCPEGTVASRLSWARQRLRARLTRRGVTLSVGVLSALLTGRAAVAPALAGYTAEAAASFAGTAPAAVPAEAGSLAGKVLKQMFWTKVRKAAGLLLTLCLVVGGGGALVGTSRGGGEPAGREVIVARPLARDVADEEDFAGVTAVHETDVRSQVAGTVAKLHFKDGDEIKASQLLVEIDAPDLKADLDRAEANLAVAETNVTQAEKQFQMKPRGSPEKRRASADVEAAKGTLAQAKVARDAAKVNLALTRLVAPVAGRAYARTATGQTVRPPDVLATVVSPGPADVEFEAPLRLLPLLGETRNAAGLPVAVGLDGEKGFPRRGTVSLTGARVDADKGVLRLVAVVPGDGIRSGQAARVRLATGKPYRALLVPPGAVHEDKTGSFVFIVNEKNEPERRRVELGSVQDGLRTVKAGLEADEWVVLDIAFRADSGAAVAPRKVSLLREEAAKGGSEARTVLLKDNGLSMTLPLKHASAADAARLAKRLYEGQLAPKGRLVLSVDDATNSLAVEGTTEQVLDVVRLVAGLEELGRRNPNPAAREFDAWNDARYDLRATYLDAFKNGKLVKSVGPRLGVTVEPLGAALVEQLSLPAGVGLLVTEVAGGSPAAKVGLQANDVLVKIDGAQVPANVDDFVKLIASFKSDTPMDVVVMRKGRRQNLGSVRLADGPAPGDRVRAKELLERYYRVKEAQARIDTLQADVEKMEDRVDWSERMVKKGYLTARQAEADRELLKKLEADLERARAELKGATPDEKESIEKWLKPRE